MSDWDDSADTWPGDGQDRSDSVPGDGPDSPGSGWGDEDDGADTWPGDGAGSDVTGGRRQAPAGHVLVAIVLGLVLATLLDASSLERRAEMMPFGARRSVAVAMVRPLVSVSHFLFLDRPAELADRALGRAPAAKASKRPRPRPSASATGIWQEPLPRPTRSRPLRLYIGGDSMAGIFGSSLVTMANATRVIKPRLDYRISTGLARPDFFDWPAHADEVAAAFRPGAVVLLMGANDNQGVQTAGGTVHMFGTEGWAREYGRRVDETIATLFEQRVRRIYWVAMPVPPPGKYQGQMAQVNDVVRARTRDRPGVEFIDGWAVFLDSDGKYNPYLRDGSGKLQQVRETDGLHLTRAGGDRLARVVLDIIKAEWLPPLKEKSGSPSPSPSG